MAAALGGQAGSDQLASCSSVLNSAAANSSGFAQELGSRDNHVLPDLLPPQIPPRNTSAARRIQDRPLSDEVALLTRPSDGLI